MTGFRRGEPLAQAIWRVTSRETLSFHMPGHAGGRGLPHWAGFGFEQLDTTELPDTDNLAQPTGMLLEAEARAARLFGAAGTLFLVNGSTCGLLAMLQATARPGELVLVGRDCHRSVLNALRLCGARAVFLDASLPSDTPLPHGPTEAAWLTAIRQYPEAVAVLVTRPNYYGTAVSLHRIVEAAHAAGMCVLVDEAHGAHFVAHAAFPDSALSCGADLVVQSVHKTLPSTSGTALLHAGPHWRGVRRGMPVADLREAVNLFQTTSPSWTLLALMDAAVTWLAEEGADAYARLLACLAQWQVPASVPGLCRLENDALPEGMQKDPTRLVLYARGAGVRLENALRRGHGIVAEMADPDRLVLITTPFHKQEDFHHLSVALKMEWAGMDRSLAAMTGKPVPLASWRPKGGLPGLEKGLPDLGNGLENGLEVGLADGSESGHGGSPGVVPKPQEMTLAALATLGRRRVPLTQAMGRVAAVPVVPYPPGVAAILPGEAYDDRHVSFLLELRDAGVALNGMEGEDVWCVEA